MQDYEQAKQVIEKILSNIPEFGSFNVSDVMKKTLSKEEYIANYEHDRTVEVILRDARLAEPVGENGFYFKLTPLGREVRLIGSFQKYLERERKRERYTDQLNESIITTNNTQKITLILTLVVASISAMATVKSCQISNQQYNEGIEVKSKNLLIEQLNNKISQKDSNLNSFSVQIDSLKHEIESLKKKL